MNIDIWENASILEFIRSMEAKGDVIHSTYCGFCQSLNLFMQLMDYLKNFYMFNEPFALSRFIRS